MECYADRQYYFPIHPAEHPDNSKLVLDDQLVLQKKSYVSTRTLHTLSCKMLRPYWDRQSGKPYRLHADSYAELLKKRANFSVAAVVPTGLEYVPAWSKPTSIPSLSYHPLVLISVTVVWVAVCENYRHGGWANSHPWLLPYYTSDNTQGDPESICLTSPGYNLSVLALGALGLHYYY